MPTICLNYQSTHTLTIIPGQDTPWDFAMTMLPHPLWFAWWEGAKAYNPVGSQSYNGAFWNSQLVPTTVPTHDELLTAWLSLAQRWRLAYQSVTIYQDGPDLSNQGTIVVAQAPLEPRLWTVSTAINEATDLVASVRLADYDRESQGPNFERSQSLPNAYMSRSREGAYVPLKLTSTCQEWHSQADNVVPMTPGDHPGPLSSGMVLVPHVAAVTYPFHSVSPAHGSGGDLAGEECPALMNGSVAHICARNLSKETSFTFYFRMGIEMQLSASSTLTPQLKLSPPYDPMALDTYFSISRELKDAYPADYNDLGRMWDVISSTVKQMAPQLRQMPFAARAEPFVRVGIGLGDAIREARRKDNSSSKGSGPVDKQPAATTERQQALRNAVSVLATETAPKRGGSARGRGRGKLRVRVSRK